jgi:hypothetical protein
MRVSWTDGSVYSMTKPQEQEMVRDSNSDSDRPTHYYEGKTFLNRQTPTERGLTESNSD